jgi:hypothetical protein
MRQVFLEGRPLHIFPCRTDKRPCTPHGHLDAVSDSASVASLWARYPGAPLVGVACGAIGGISVIDIDPNGESWFHAHRDQLPQTRTHKTRREGWHLIYRHAPGLRCSNGKIAPGVDIKTDGNYVIWWPAAAGRVLCSEPIAPFPAWVIAALSGVEVASLSHINGHTGQTCSRLGSEISLNPNRPHLLPVEPTRNFPRRIDHILRRVEAAKPGEPLRGDHCGRQVEAGCRGAIASIRGLVVQADTD